MLSMRYLLLNFACWTFVACQTPSKDSYSQFDLFKNTGLHQCSSAPNTASKRLVPRRGGGAHVSGGGGGGGGTDDASVEFIRTVPVNSETAFCSHLNGTAIMIPTIATQRAFIPWWPTYAAHLLSISVTYFGLWRTSRKIRKTGSSDMPLPTLFWVQLPYDVARAIAWLVKAIQGLADHTKMTYISSVIWLISWNYMWLLRLVSEKRGETYENCPQDVPPEPNYYGYKEQFVVQEQPAQGQFSTSPRSKWRLPKSLIAAAASFAGILAGIQWILTAVFLYFHWKDSYAKKILEYLESPNAISNPASISPNMPAGCLAYLEKTDIRPTLIAEMTIEEFIIVGLTTYQFGICTVAFLARVGKFFSDKNKNKSKPTLNMLKISAFVTLAALVLPVLYIIIVTFAVKKGTANVFYTNDLNVTAGCTFATLSMDKRWGLWDVSYNRPYRIGMSVLGAF